MATSHDYSNSNPSLLCNQDDIAIIGTACRVAGADSPAKLWDVLAKGKDVQKPLTRFHGKGFYAPDGGPRSGLTNVKGAYFIDGDVSRFDNGFFAIGGHEAAAMDPQQRVLLEVAYEAFENAGITLEDLSGSDTAVFASTTAPDYLVNTLRDLSTTPKYTSTGSSSPAILANRISYFFDLHGPSMVVDTACSSTMVSMHYACQAIKSGESKMALVSGVNLILNPDMFVHMSQMGFLSPSGRCQSFDAKGDGYARGEGALAVVLKPLHQALADGDPVRAVIKATRINHNGRTQGISLPSRQEQRRNLEALYSGPYLDPADIQYFEAHGTGTAAGDPIELGAINEVFFPPTKQRENRPKLIVGSVKSNIGHLESCAALAGVIKTVECLERAQIPPQMNFSKPNPKIDFSNIEIPTSLTPWPQTLPHQRRRAAINSFGFGGVNAHAILEEAPPSADVNGAADDHPKLFKVSASNDSSLEETICSLAEYAESKPNLSDLAHTLLSRRSTLKRSVFLSASTHQELLHKLQSSDVKTQAVTKTGEKLSTARVGFIFTGQGAQWPGMAQHLLQHSLLFQAIVQESDRVLQSLPDAPSWSAYEELNKPKDTSRVNISSLSQPLCTILQIGLVEIWKSWGITPEIVAGHSSGEVAAAYAAGILSLRDAVVVAFYRGLYLGSDGSTSSAGKQKGGMCAVGLSEAAARDLVKPYQGKVGVAAVNSPSSCTLSGDIEAVQDIAEQCKQDGTFCRVLRVDMAYHSHHMLPLSGKYEEAMAKAGVRPKVSSTAVKMFSSVHGRLIEPHECSPAYWKQNMISPVLFTAALRAMVADSDAISALVEIGPHPALKGPVGDTLADFGLTEVSYFSSLFRGKADIEALHESAGRMIAAGLCLNTARINAIESVSTNSASPWDIIYRTGRVLKDLPAYRWDHSTSHWHESRISRNLRQRQFPHHEVLGARIMEDSPLRMVWRNILTLGQVPWLAEAKERGEEVLPMSLYLAMATEAARQVALAHDVEHMIAHIEKLVVRNDVPLSRIDGDSSLETHFIIETAENALDGRFTVTVPSEERTEKWFTVCEGSLLFTHHPTVESKLVHSNQVAQDGESEEVLQSLGCAQLQHIKVTQADATTATGHLKCPETPGYSMSPTTLDEVLQIPKAIILRSALPGKYRIRAIDAIEACNFAALATPDDLEFSVQATDLGCSAGSAIVDVESSNKGTSYLRIRGLTFERYNDAHAAPPLKTLFYKPQLLPDISSPLFRAAGQDIELELFLTLVSHKYPAADIALMGLEDGVVERINTYLQSSTRQPLRSITIVGDCNKAVSDIWQRVPRLSPAARFHAIIRSQETAEVDLSTHLLPFGLLCTIVDASAIKMHIETVEGLSSKPSASEARTAEASPIGVFTTPSLSTNLQSYVAALRDRLPSVIEAAIPQSKAENTVPPTCKHAIILDGGLESMLARQPAGYWLPWLQSLVANVETLLWITFQDAHSPFSGIAGSFIRTLKAEDPALRATSLIVHNSTCCDISIVTSVFHDLLSGSSQETELVAKEGKVHCLRYLPDDERNANTGAAAPTYVRKSLTATQYRIAAMGKQSVSLAQAPPRRPHQLDPDSILLETLATCIDFSDVSEYLHPSPKADKMKSGLGLFCAGTVRASSAGKGIEGKRVVAWTPGAHRSSLTVPVRNAHIIPDGMSPAQAVACFAAVATAFAIVDGMARARSGDCFNARLSGQLAAALDHVANVFGARCDVHSESADFIVSFDKQQSLTVNGRPVSVRHYLESGNHMSSIVQHFDLLMQDAPAALSTFGLASIRAAFDAAVSRPLDTVLLHTDKELTTTVLVDRAALPRLFSPEGAYILLGGMGGLGRHLAPWMIRHGARTLVSISRSGLASAEAQSTAKQVEEMGGQVMAFSVDVSDGLALGKALEDVRARHKIRGCLNLAMVLQDAPFSKMTAERWDTAIRVKVEGSWNLHQATLEDDLDFFIMFSSVSSVTGNRSQSNYATGNAFQNALAAYRQSIGLTGLSIALGSMSGIGVLANETALLEYCAQMGHSRVGPDELEKVMESAILSSASPDCPALLGMGLEMFETIDGVVQKKASQSQAFWTDMPEFSSLMAHSASGGESQARSLKERLAETDNTNGCSILGEAFAESLSTLMGYPVEKLDLDSSIAAYGLDSLNAMSCRYWFFQQIGVDVPVFDILGCKSIRALIQRVCDKFYDSRDQTEGQASAIPQPTRHTDLDHRPLSHSQRRLWFLQNFLEDKSVYNLLLVCHIEGKVDVPAFKQAWSTLLRRHEALHSRLIDTNEGLQQLPVAVEAFPITEVVAGEDDFESTVAHITHIARNYVFDIESAELVRGWLLESPRGWRFFLTSHHLAWDRSSVPTIFAETTSAYKALTAGKAAETELEPVAYQFIDYTLWQEACLQTPSYIDPLVKYWSERLEGRPEAVSLLPMALSDKRPTVKQLKTSHVCFTLDAAMGQAIKTFCAKHAATPFMFTACSLAALVHRLTGDEDIILGIADGDRGHSAFDNMIGFTVNMLPIRSKMQSTASFATLLEEYRSACLGAYEHRAMPFDYLLSVLDMPRRTAHSPVFQITVNYQMHGSFPEVDYGDFKFVDYDHYNARQQVDFSLGIEETASGSLECDFEFDTAIYSEQGMRDLAAMYEIFVKSVVACDGSAPLSDVNILSEADEQTIRALLEPEHTQNCFREQFDSSLFPVLFERAVAAHPNKPALVDESRTLTWAEADSITRRIASKLLECNLPRNSPVGLFSEQSVDLVLAAWAIVRSGHAYVPLDPDFPDARLLSMIEDVEMQVAVVDGNHDGVGRLVGCGLKVANVFDIQQILSAPSAVDERCIALPSVRKDDFFCCVFTSGSTGKPKGVYLGHQQLRYHQEGYCDIVGTNQDDRILLASAMVFDASLCAIYGGVLKGATVVVAGREARYSPTKMIDLVLEQRISNLLITPTQAAILLTTPANRKRLQMWSSLRGLALGGEPISPHLLRDLFALQLGDGKASIFNVYGPSECTISCSVKRLQPADLDRPSIPLALPQFPARLYILDKNRNRVPVGVPGELWIGGPLVNKGYIKRPDLTKQAFVTDPFVTDSANLIYRTGDLFSLARDGLLTAHGRIAGDRQTKIRGMRIELDEIEGALHDALADLEDGEGIEIVSLAVVHHKKGADNGILAAYFATGEQQPSEADQRTMKRYFRQVLLERLPRHMVPTAFVWLNELPRTVAGKTDYRTMAAWPAPKPDTSLALNALDGVGGGGPQLSKLQKDIAAVWRSVLGFDASEEENGEEGDACDKIQIGLEDDFFSLGGHSLLLMKLQDGLYKKFGAMLSLAAMFGNPTVAGIERLLVSSPEWKNGNLKDEYQEEESDKAVSHGDVGNVPDTTKNAEDQIDWDKEMTLARDIVESLRKTVATTSPVCSTLSTCAIAITGATTMIGVHLLYYLLTHTSFTLYCLAVPAETHNSAKAAIVTALQDYRLTTPDLANVEARIFAFAGQLSHPTLGLSDQEIALVNEKTEAIFHVDSDVSLLKNYAGVRPGNVGALEFLIRLASGVYSPSTATSETGQIKTINYLSTWGVPHLQVWNKTQLSPPGRVIVDEQPMTHMTPSPDPGLAYLKARWVCERLLGEAASLGLPVNIFRPSMVANSERSGRGLKRDDINRRIVEGSLQTGCVPDFGSARGGGMSWMSVDWLVDAMAKLSGVMRLSGSAGAKSSSADAAAIYHLVADTHIPYNQLAPLLGKGYDGMPLKTVRPQEWFAALRSKGNPEMAMQAEVLESWWAAGWFGFRLDDARTRNALKSLGDMSKAANGPVKRADYVRSADALGLVNDLKDMDVSGGIKPNNDAWVVVSEMSNSSSSDEATDDEASSLTSASDEEGPMGMSEEDVLKLRDWMMRCVVGEKGF